MQFWLLKTEPYLCSIQDIENKKVVLWDGVRNFQARNFLKQMKKDDKCFIYHSSCKTIGVAGVAQVHREFYDDLDALNPQSQYFDPKSTKEKNRWVVIDLKWSETFKEIVTLEWIKSHQKIIEILLKNGNSRLSVMPVSEYEYYIIYKHAQTKRNL
jgi:predicted RNA-binding protein with PUA-like domain